MDWARVDVRKEYTGCTSFLMSNRIVYMMDCKLVYELDELEACNSSVSIWVNMERSWFGSGLLVGCCNVKLYPLNDIVSRGILEVEYVCWTVNSLE